MNDVEAAPHLPLLQGLLKWGDSRVIERIRHLQRHLTLSELARHGGPIIVPHSELTQPSLDRWMAGPPHFALLDEGWATALRGFSRRIENAELFVSGVGFDDDVPDDRQVAIPGAYATKMQFGLLDNQIRIGRRLFLSIRVSDRPLTVVKPERPPPTSGRGDEAAPTMLVDGAAYAAGAPGHSQGIARGLRKKSDYDDLILEALRKRRPQIDGDGELGVRRTALASWISKDLAARYPDRAKHRKLPAEQTIRTRLTPLYQKVLDEQNAE